MLSTTQNKPVSFAGPQPPFVNLLVVKNFLDETGVLRSPPHTDAVVRHFHSKRIYEKLDIILLKLSILSRPIMEFLLSRWGCREDSYSRPLNRQVDPRFSTHNPQVTRSVTPSLFRGHKKKPDVSRLFLMVVISAASLVQ